MNQSNQLWGGVVLLALLVLGFNFIDAGSNSLTARKKTTAPAVLNNGDICSRQPTPVKQLACRVGEVATILTMSRVGKKTAREYRKADVFHKFAALKAMEYIQSHVSSARYAFERDENPESFVIPEDENAALRRGIGICGNQVAVLLAVMKELGIKVRPIQFWYESETGVRLSHIAAEVHYHDEWHYFDVTWGAFYTDQDKFRILPIDEVLANKDRQIHVNSTNVWYQNSIATVGLEATFSHLYRDIDITKNEIGTVTAYSVLVKSGLYEMQFSHIPGYIGDNKSDGRQAGIDYRFDVPAGKYQIELAILVEAGCGKSRLFINDKAVAFTNKRASLIVDNPQTANVRGSDDVCYYVIKNIKMEKLD